MCLLIAIPATRVQGICPFSAKSKLNLHLFCASLSVGTFAVMGGHLPLWGDVCRYGPGTFAGTRGRLPLPGMFAVME